MDPALELSLSLSLSGTRFTFHHHAPEISHGDLHHKEAIPKYNGWWLGGCECMNNL